MDWLDNTCQNETEKEEIINRHRKTSSSYRSLANYIEEKDDIFVNIRHFMITGEK